MTVLTHQQLSPFIWSICNLLRGPFDLSPAKVDNHQMGFLFEELIRIGVEQSNEDAGHHFTPREVIRLFAEQLLPKVISALGGSHAS